MVVLLATGIPTTSVAAETATSSTETTVTRAHGVAITSLSGSAFKPGYIISDALFFDSNAMTQAQIQSFLLAKSGGCDNAYCLGVYKTSTVSKPADNMCAAYTGATNEAASTIIYKVQRACGISAKVILVTLQKEQTLVTQSAPTSLELRKAMGYGCPDTSACDSTYYGFFNQVYQAARQLKRYTMPAPDNISFHYYPPGATSNIKYHPNAACGTKAVFIQNHATAALYYYTPYTPNAAALANLGGVGDSCSSYGNRNFWVFYNNWFGATNLDQGQTIIDARYASEGGASGYLGAAGTSACTATSSSCSQEFDGGVIYWERYAGAWPVRTDYLPAYRESGGPTGPLGYPSGVLVQVTGNPNGDGAGQQFQNGTIYSSANGTFAVYGGFRAEYWRLGSNRGGMGWPVASVACVSSECSQEFQHGIVFSSSAYGSRTVEPSYLSAYLEHKDSVGVPVGRLVAITTNPNGAGSGQSYLRGSMYSSAAGVFPVLGVIRSEYWRLGGNSGTLGWPIHAATCSSGLCTQQFQGGTISQVSATTAFGMRSDYATVYEANRAVLGLPKSGYVAFPSTPNGPGGAQSFSTGSIYSSAAGVYPIWGPVRAEFWRVGSAAGSFGWPTAAPVCTGGLCTQSFQGGTIAQASATKAFAMRSDYATVYSANTAALGAPVGGYVAISTKSNGSGGGQSFATGSIYSSSAGVFPVWGAVRAEYWRTGGVAGSLGWPTASPVCASGLCSQTFQRGSIIQVSATKAYTLSAAVASVYGNYRTELGQPTSGYVTVSVNPNGPGGGQSFATGSIYSSAAGVFPVWGAVRTEYWRLGGNRGSLGWPTGNPVCTAGVCTQTFQHGTITK